MIRTYSQIIGTPILSHEDGRAIALLQDVIINPDTGKLEGFWVKPLTLPMGNAIIQNSSILEWKKNIYINDEREITEPEDIIKISEILEMNTLIIGNRVKNESGDELGSVHDLDFDTEKLYLRNLYTQKAFFVFKYDHRIFNYDTIVKVLPEYILVKEIEEKKEEAKEPALMKDEQPVMDV